MAGRTHNYTRHRNGTHYVIEPVTEPTGNKPQGQRFCMTATGRGIRPQDYIVLAEAGNRVRYQVEEINYYCGTPDYWIALLIRC